MRSRRTSDSVSSNQSAAPLHDTSWVDPVTFETEMLTTTRASTTVVTSGTHPLTPNNDNNTAVTVPVVDAPQPTTRMPRHVAVVCDGNARWARQRGLPSVMGHAAGAKRLVQVWRTLQDTPGVTHCTVYGFSTENWQRSDHEIADIFSVMEQTIRRLHDTILEERVVLKVIGDLNDKRIPATLRECLQQLEQATRLKHTVEHGSNANDIDSTNNDGCETPNVMTLCLAINYGGRQDILQASRRLAALIANGTIDASNVTEDSLAACLDTATMPNPDLWIRTSGEYRLSNFLLWDTAYTELYFTETLWPDFDAHELRKALTWYGQRQRRFGSRPKTQS